MTKTNRIRASFILGAAILTGAGYLWNTSLETAPEKKQEKSKPKQEEMKETASSETPYEYVIVNDNVKGVAAAGFHRDELFVGCSIVEQIAGHKVSILRKALARGNGRRWLRGRSFFHNRRFLIPAVRIGIGRDCKAA